MYLLAVNVLFITYSGPAVEGNSEHGPHEEPVVKGISDNYKDINCKN